MSAHLTVDGIVTMGIQCKQQTLSKLDGLLLCVYNK